MAPVCDAAALPPASVSPPRITTTGLHGGRVRGDVEEAATVVDALDVHEHALGALVGAQVVEHVDRADLGLVAHADELVEPDLAALGRLDHLHAEVARLRDEAERCPAVGAA